MKQVVQDFKTGRLFVDEVPVPALVPGFVLVRNHYSLISAGTERSTVSTAQASLLGKAKQRPDLVKQVLDNLKKDGFSETLKRVRTKLETLKELGYSSAGTVLASLDHDGRFKPGDRVACGGGGYATHASVVSVPQNLVVKVPDSVDLDVAAFTTVGAIAMQGVRQANPRLGEFVCVIGLGLLGQITAQILRANGCEVFGVDTSEAAVDLARKSACHDARNRSDPGLATAMDVFTGGRGFDAVIITAATQSTDPVELASAVLRQKGVIVIVGAVPLNVSREPHFYRKELELKISCSYGPGRYDSAYEERGIDYPYGYVRWTENRNMSAFVRLLQKKAVDVSPLITHVFDIEHADRAYDIVMGKVQEHHVAILLKYPDAKAVSEKCVTKCRTAKPCDRLGIGFIGAGSFAQKFLIPYARHYGELVAVVTSRGITARSVAQKFGFSRFTTELRDILDDTGVNAVFIATRHNTHAALTVAALKAGKNVFVEKPLCLTRDELGLVLEAAQRPGSGILMVGFNRRFAPLAVEARRFFSQCPEPLVINCRVNAGVIPRDHWIQTEEGGGRILGEVCHFVDLLQHLVGADPVSVFAQCVQSENWKVPDQDNIVIVIRFSNGSIGEISYTASGDKLLGKERIEVFGGGQSFIIDDFRTGECYSGARRKRLRMPGKGHQEEVKAFLEAVRNGLPSPVSLGSVLMTTASTFAILDSLRTGLPQAVVLP